jgi:hypothetical protein
MRRVEEDTRDNRRSMIPMMALILVGVVKPILYVAVHGILNPFVIFAPWQMLAWLAALAAVIVDINQISWFAGRISQLQNEMNIER